MSPGYFFSKASWIDKKEKSQIFVYNKIRRKKNITNSDADYPIYAVMEYDRISFYCASHHLQTVDQESYPAYYGTSLIEQVNFDTLHTGMIEKWLNRSGFLSKDLLATEFYDKEAVNDRLVSYSSVFKRAKITKEKELSTNQQSDPKVGSRLLYKELLLDFLFDLYHSNVFDETPAEQRLKDTLENNVLATCILSKYDFLYYDILVEDSKTGSKVHNSGQSEQ
jgi:hypothetical protein